MSKWQRLSTGSQLALHLRAELERGRWTGRMPGVIRLAVELGVARNTVESALRELERDGVLVPQMVGKGRLIDLKGRTKMVSGLRVAILTGERSESRLDYMVELKHKLEESGHSVIHPSQSMTDLGMDLKRIAGLVGRTAADAWVVLSGPREVLEWFAAQSLPAFALFGRRRGLPIAGGGPDKVLEYARVTRSLIALGHRRIVLLARTRRRLPEPGASETSFLNELNLHGISAGSYHLPHWEESIEGFQHALEELFRITPPTAMIIQEAPLFVAAQQFLANRRIRVPQEVSLVCTDHDPTFEWCCPSISHIRWDSRPLVRRIVRWAAHVSLGKPDLRQTLTPAEFVPGGTIGRVVHA